MTQIVLAGIAGLIGLLAGFGIGAIDTDHRAEEQRESGYGMMEESRTGGKGQGMAGTATALETPLPSDFVSVRPEVTALAAEDVSAEERAGLVYMREEEKLARDVYLTLYDRWGLNIFSNIAQSEQTHTEAVRDLLVKYDVTDPVTDYTVGVFTDPTLQSLYDTLVTQGAQSEVEALKVGAAIEELDIKDIATQIALTDNADIALVYENLMRGSRNHLRSFTSQLSNRGVTYEPEYISATEYQSIVTTDRETGSGQQRGFGGGNGTGGNSGGRGRQ